MEFILPLLRDTGVVDGQLLSSFCTKFPEASFMCFFRNLKIGEFTKKFKVIKSLIFRNFIFVKKMGSCGEIITRCAETLK